MIAVFETEPALGTRILLDDQTYELVAVEPYTRKTDGRSSFLLSWDSVCPDPDCGCNFRAMSGMRIASLDRRCEHHRSFNKPVKGRRGRRVVVRIELP